MKLTDLFLGNKQIADAGKTQVNTARTDVVNRQIQSMVPGQTIQGEVVSKNGNEVQIRVNQDLVLQAKVEQNMNLEVGKNMTFEVKNNGKALVLSPLFTNVATDANVMKALDMAALPLNDTTIALTKQLMEAGLSIDRNSLQQVFREVNQYPRVEISDIVNLHKMQMPVNEGNVTQMASYRNLTHQLVTGINQVLDAVPDMLNGMMENGNTEGAVKLYQQLVLMAQEASVDGNTLKQNVSTEAGVTQTVLPDGTILSEGVPQGMLTAGIVPEGITGEGNMTDILFSGQISEGITQQAFLQGNASQSIIMQEGMIQGTVAEQETLQEMQKTVDTLLDIPLTAQNEETASVQNANAENSNHQTMQTILQNHAVMNEQGFVYQEEAVANQASQQLQNLLGKIPKDLSAQNILNRLTQMMQDSSGGKEFLKPFMQLLKQQWTITPEQVSDAEQVESLYRRMDKQLKNLSQAIESAGATNTAAYKAVTNMTQNLDFLQQVNQLYTYVQLPLRLQNGEAHGDLYVYTNKKHLAAKDGQISALLHLDMENLGPVDVYVSMMNEKVNTKFYLQDDEMLDFLMEHMDILTERLKKRGYQCSFEMQVREQDADETKTSIQKLLEQENHIPLAEYAFDVRT
uniref:flagellar hook-length control protein FliK n=1 Tax=Acetatifactor sp. TaxID=1872090 RepID=UPI0040564CE6